MKNPIRIDTDLYNADYYERGVEKGISGYTNYKWKPEYSLPFANELKKRFLGRASNEKVLDYGCAKGFLVKAFRMLDVNAYGYDISLYAISGADKKVREFVSCDPTWTENSFSLVVSKDTLEHVSKEQLQEVLGILFYVCRGIFVATVPLGDSGQYRIREYELDKTHRIREDEEWWTDQFQDAGFRCLEFDYAFPHAKDHWLKVHPFGNGTWVLSKVIK